MQNDEWSSGAWRKEEKTKEETRVVVGKMRSCLRSEMGTIFAIRVVPLEKKGARAVASRRCRTGAESDSQSRLISTLSWVVEGELRGVGWNLAGLRVRSSSY